MPTFSKVWRAVVAALASLFVVVLGVMPAHAESPEAAAAAAEPGFIADTSFSGNEVSLTVTGKLKDKTLKAVKIADYTQVQVDNKTAPTKITGFDVKGTPAPVVEKIDAAIQKVSAVKSMTTSTPPASGIIYSSTNPVPWLIQNLTNSQNSPYDGSLRDVLTQLANDEQFVKLATLEGTFTEGGEDKEETVTFNVTPGIYIIFDVTDPTGEAKPLPSVSIPMMTGTGIKIGEKPASAEQQDTPVKVDTLAKANSDFSLGTVEYKEWVPTIEKKIVDGGKSVDQISAGIGDTIIFTLTTQVPNWTGYDKYFFKMSDTLSPGLTFDGISSVKVGETGLGETEWKLYPAESAAIAAEGADKGKTKFDIIFAPDESKISDLVAAGKTDGSSFAPSNIGKTLVVTYTAKLNKDAVIKGDGNPNEVDLTYSHDPNDGSKTTTTPPDTVKVYTGYLKLVKEDMNAEGLAGAKFKVTRESKEVKFVKSSDGATYRVADATETTGTTTEVVSREGVITFNGLSGTYTFEETESPFGTNAQLLPKFTVAVETKEEKNESSSSVNTTYTVNRNVNVAATGLVSFDSNDTVTVKNPRSLLDMPKTGSIWLVIYGVGALLCAVAAYFLLFRRRSED